MQLADDADIRCGLRRAMRSKLHEWVLQQLPEPERITISRPIQGLVMAQLFRAESCSYSYILGCEEARTAVVIDPTDDDEDPSHAVVRDLGLRLRFAVTTSSLIRVDRTATGRLVETEVPDVKSWCSEEPSKWAEVMAEAGHVVKFGRFCLEALPTPGHTELSVAWVLHGSPSLVFTGETLLIRGCGKVELHESDAGQLYDSVRRKLFTLPRDTLVYPGRDAQHRNVSTIEAERCFNPCMNKSREDFLALVSESN